MPNRSSNKKTFLKSLARLGIPIAVQNLLSFSVSFTSSLMVARLGDEAVSGVYMGNQIKILLTFFICGVEGAITSLCAQYHGKGEHDKIKKLLCIGASFAAGISLLLTLVCFFFPVPVVRAFTDNSEIVNTGAGYLKILCLSFVFFALSQILLSAFRSVEDTKIGFISSAVTLAVNAMLGYLLVFGKFGLPRLGIKGAAIAALLAHISELATILVYTICIDKKLRIRTKKFISELRFDKKLVREFIKYGSPIILGQILWGANMLFATAVIGRRGKAAVTAMSIAGSILNLSHIVTNGTSGALGILIGKALGEEKYDEAERNSKTAQPLFILLGVLTSLFILLIKSPFISIYSISADAIREAGYFINVLAAVTVGTCYQSAVLNGILKSAKDTRFVFKVEAFAFLFGILPLSLIASRLSLSPWVIFAALKCDQFIKCIPAAIRAWRLKWLRNSRA